MNLITEFKENHLRSVIEEGERAENVRCRFVKGYPYEKISSMSIDEYMIAKEGYGNNKSFCSRLRNEMDIIAPKFCYKKVLRPIVKSGFDAYNNL